MVGDNCEFAFTVTDIPEGEAIYSFRAGNSVRDGMKYTRDQLEERGELPQPHARLTQDLIEPGESGDTGLGHRGSKGRSTGRPFFDTQTSGDIQP